MFIQTLLIFFVDIIISWCCLHQGSRRRSPVRWDTPPGRRRWWSSQPRWGPWTTPCTPGTGTRAWRPSHPLKHKNKNFLDSERCIDFLLVSLKGFDLIFVHIASVIWLPNKGARPKNIHTSPKRRFPLRMQFSFVPLMSLYSTYLVTVCSWWKTLVAFWTFQPLRELCGDLCFSTDIARSVRVVPVK